MATDESEMGTGVDARRVQRGDLDLISNHLREILHNINNSMFVMKGFLEEARNELEALESGSDKELSVSSLRVMLETIERNAGKLDTSVQTLRKFAKSDLYQFPFALAETKQET